MKIVIVGAGSDTVTVVRTLLDAGHEVVVIERNRERIDELSEELDCGFLNGDGTRPQILREADPERSDVLLALTRNDQGNILAALVGRHLGFRRVVVKIEDPQFESLCEELGLDDTIVPDRTIARVLTDLLAGKAGRELSNLMRADVHFFSFRLEADTASLVEVEVPDHTHAIGISRGDEFLLPARDEPVRAGDEVIVITNDADLAELKARYGEGGD